MAEFVDVIHQTKRICKSVNGHCDTCLMGASYCPNNARFDSTDEQKFIDFANAVMAWAAEHPEPVYPTWGEYLCNIGLIHDCEDVMEMGRRLFHNSIPADIAQKLGVEPKEGVC